MSFQRSFKEILNKFKEKLNSYFLDLYTGEEKIILDLEPNKLLTFKNRYINKSIMQNST